MSTSTRIQLFCLWCGPAGILLWLIGFVFAGHLIPPPTPAETAEEITSFYRAHSTGIKAGLLMTMIGATFTGPFVAAISGQIKRIEGQVSPLTYLQLGMGMLDITAFIFPVMFMQVAAFRADRDPSLVLFANDMAWIPFVSIWSMAFVQNLSLGLAAFQDKEQKVFPRWFGYYNMWSIVLYVPGSMLYFFQHGPFTWNGPLSWWIVVVDFVLWFVVTVAVVHRAIVKQGRAEQLVAKADVSSDGRSVSDGGSVDATLESQPAVSARPAPIGR